MQQNQAETENSLVSLPGMKRRAWAPVWQQQCGARGDRCPQKSVMSEVSAKGQYDAPDKQTASVAPAASSCGNCRLTSRAKTKTTGRSRIVCTTYWQMASSIASRRKQSGEAKITIIRGYYTTTPLTDLTPASISRPVSTLPPLREFRRAPDRRPVSNI